MKDECATAVPPDHPTHIGYNAWSLGRGYVTVVSLIYVDIYVRIRGHFGMCSATDDGHFGIWSVTYY